MPNIKIAKQLIQTAGGVVVNPDGQILVVLQDSGIWSLPKGHVDPGENELEAAKREIFEESGISNLEYIKELGSYVRPSSRGMKELHFFLFKTKQTDLKPIEDDIKEVKWVPIDQVADLLDYQENKDFFESIKDQIQI